MICFKKTKCIAPGVGRRIRVYTTLSQKVSFFSVCSEETNQLGVGPLWLAKPLKPVDSRNLPG